MITFTTAHMWVVEQKKVKTLTIVMLHPTIEILDARQFDF